MLQHQLKKKMNEKKSFKSIYLYIGYFKTIELENRKLHTHKQGPKALTQRTKNSDNNKVQK